MLVTIKDNFSIFKAKTVMLHQGLTIIAGCNGAGKTTFCREIVRNAENKHITCAYLDCNKDFHVADLNYLDKHFSTAAAVSKLASSEHEFYERMFAEWTAQLRPGDSFRGKPFVAIIDGLDSGGDITFFQTHIDLFKLMVQDAENRGIEMYVIVTCNNFYYLAYGDSGEAIYLPTFKRKKLPVYTARQFNRYIEDIKSTAIARGFISGN